jgi:hypothetical protein
MSKSAISLETVSKQLKELQNEVHKNGAQLSEMMQVFSELSAKMDMLMVGGKTVAKKSAKADDESVSMHEDDKSEISTAVKKVKKTVAMNKMNFFKKMYEQDETYFNQYLTDAVRATIDSTPEFAKLSAADLKAAKRKAYYEYMTEHHDKELLNMKTAHLEEQAERAEKKQDAETEA